MAGTDSPSLLGDPVGQVALVSSLNFGRLTGCNLPDCWFGQLSRKL